MPTHHSTASTEHLLTVVCRALDRLIVTAESYHGLFPSLLNRQTGAMLTAFPTPIPGQRNGDRAPLGSNLMHDVATLNTLYALATALNRTDYAVAADAYLRRFACHCTDTATGLFPWGEHSYWHLIENRVGNGYCNDGASHSAPTTHDHLRQAPCWLWEALWRFNPRCVERFAEGLDFHWQEGKHEEYIRHASIEEHVYPHRDERSCDFPRHSGFYILDWAFAWIKTGRADFLQQMHDMLDYWWDRRDDRGLLLIESRCPPDGKPPFHGINAPGQTVSLAASLLESAVLLKERLPKLAATMRERAGVYIDGFCAAPHNIAQGVFVILSRRDNNTATEQMPIWGSKYGLWPASYVALTCLCAYRLTGDVRLLAWASAVGQRYARQPFPGDIAVPAMDAGLGLGLLADLYDLTGDTQWRDSALALADTCIAVYLDSPLPRGAAGIDWYESQMGSGFLLHGLARIALLTVDSGHCPLAADYTAR